jgi:hypothetical protein
MLVLVPRIDRKEALAVTAVAQRLPVSSSVLYEVAEPPLRCFVQKEGLRKTLALTGRHVCSG